MSSLRLSWWKLTSSLTASQWNCSSKNLEVPSVRFATKKVKKYIFSLVTFMHQSGLRLGKVNSQVSSCIKTYLCIILKFAYRQLNGLCAIWVLNFSCSFNAANTWNTAVVKIRFFSVKSSKSGLLVSLYVWGWGKRRISGIHRRLHSEFMQAFTARVFFWPRFLLF